MSAWSQALKLADQTPEARNRYVDLLRALSIGAVVFGHWLMAAPFVDGERLQLGNMLGVERWTQWLTWMFQVMPVFFIVGGYANAASWDAAQRNGLAYGEWLTARLRRLIGPVLPLLLVWTAIAIVARLGGVAPATIQLGSQAALVPTWFLAVYVLVGLLVPFTRAAWRKLGIFSFWLFALAAVAVDVAAFAGGLTWLRWTNYLFIWVTVHQLGYLWRDGRMAGTLRALPWAAGGLALLVGLVEFAGYPLSMVGVPGEPSNTLPPTLAMLALGMLQGGLLLSIEAPARRWLRRRAPWAATILINGTIMSVYLWHMTAAILLVGLAWKLGGIGLTLQPGSDAWWLGRPVWMAVYAVGLTILLALFARFERLGAGGAALPAWRCVVGSLLFCAGLALITLQGVAGEGPFLGLRIWLLAALFGGALISFGPRR